MNEEDEKDLWDARSGLRTSLGLGFEVGANTLLDIFSFIPPAQVAGGTFINYLAQKIRGGEISKGELTAAGLTSLIPGGTQARALTRGGRFYRSVAKGGLAGGITTTSMSLIDENEFPSFGELAGGVGLGGAFGGAFDLAPAAVTGRLGKEVSEIADDTLNFTSALRNKIRTGTREATKGLDVFREGGVMDIGAGGLGRGRRSTQYRLFFDWETTPNAAKVKANIGDTVGIISRKVFRNKNLVTRKSIKFTKPESIDLTNGFKPTKQHRNFSEFIEDLIEADRIPAQNITPDGFKAISARSSTPELDLYQDYIAGYFNTYGTLDGITKVILNNKTLKLGGKSLDNLKQVERLLKAYKLNPAAFRSGAFNPANTSSKEILEAFSQSNDLDDFLLKFTKLQRHHIAVLDDSFALVDGLTGNDLQRMHQIIAEEGLAVGNDPNNLQLLPRDLHQGFIHPLWKAIGPDWVGTDKLARLKRKNMINLSPEARRVHVQQLKDAITELNIFMEDVIQAYIKEVKKGGTVTLQDKQSLLNYLQKYIRRSGMFDSFDVETTVRSTSKPNKLELDELDEKFAFGEDTGI